MNYQCPRIVNWGWEVGEARNSIVADTLRDVPRCGAHLVPGR